MFVDAVDAEVMRLMAAAPEWPTPDEMWNQYPPTAPPDGDPADDAGAATLGGVPADVDPDGWLALQLDAATADPRALSDAELIDSMAGFGRVENWAQARQTRLVAEFDRRRPGSAARYAPDEISLALSVSRFVAVGRIAQARLLVDVLTDTLAVFEAGRVDGYKVRLICDAVRHLDDAQATWVQDRVLPRAPEQSAAQLRAALARAVIAADPDCANERHRRARKDRRVGVGQEDDGMASLWAYLSAQDARTVFGTLSGLARALGAEDPRGMDARRADLLVGLLTGELSIAHARPESSANNEARDSGVSGTGSTDEPIGMNEPGADDPGADEFGSTATSSTATSSTATSSTATSSAATSSAATSSAATSSAGEPRDGESSSDEPGNAGKPGRGDGSGAGVPSVGGPVGCAICAVESSMVPRPWLRPVSAGKPLVQVLMAHSTLRGADHAPAELVGHGAICADQARAIAADAVWRRLVFDDESGAVLDCGRHTYRPPAALADHVRARDVHCRSPLCRRRALDCELDHTVPFPLGPTAEHNLTDGCALHHHEKHTPGWTVLQHPDGRVDWITPTGHVYSSEVHDYRPLPAPPSPSIPGPIADRTHTQPAPPAPATPTRPQRVRDDWAGGPGERGDDPPPF